MLIVADFIVHIPSEWRGKKQNKKTIIIQERGEIRTWHSLCYSAYLARKLFLRLRPRIRILKHAFPNTSASSAGFDCIHLTSKPDLGSFISLIFFKIMSSRKQTKIPSKALLLWKDTGVSRVPLTRIVTRRTEIAVGKEVQAWWSDPSDVLDAEILYLHGNVTHYLWSFSEY